MQNFYNEYFFQQFTASDHQKEFLPFFENMAKRIVADLNPESVLDAGCAVGYLVEALRRENVEAYGFDFSPSAIDNAREEARPYVLEHSLLKRKLPFQFPRKVDLAVCIEVLEHISGEDAERAIENLCSYSDCILFSSTSKDIESITHINVRPPEYWCKLFAKHGFFRNISYTPSYISANAICFVKRKGADMPALVEEYERFFRVTHDNAIEQSLQKQKSLYTSEIRIVGEAEFLENMTVDSCDSDFKWHVPLPINARGVYFWPALRQSFVAKNLSVAIAGQALSLTDADGNSFSQIDTFSVFDQPICASIPPGFGNIEGQFIDICGDIYVLSEEHMIALSARFSELRKKSSRRQKMQLLAQKEHLARMEDLDAECHHLRTQLDSLRLQSSELKDDFELMKNSNSWKLTAPFRYIKKAFKRVVRDFFYASTAGRKAYTNLSAVYRLGLAETRFNKKYYGEPYCPPLNFLQGRDDLEKQWDDTPESVCISICVPLYNTRLNHLEDMLRSVRYQSYPFWELCLADASDDEHAYVGQFIKKYAKNDSRIKYIKLGGNAGISGNTNEAIALAEGQYIGLLDHDDMLNYNALYEVQKTICVTGADFLYSDKLTFKNDDLSNIVTIYHKPDFAIDTFRANNYLCHFSVFSRDLLQAAGGKLRADFDGSQDYDLFLRLVEKTDAIVHIPKILYFWRAHEKSVAQDIKAKPYAVSAAVKALEQHFVRCGIAADVEEASHLQAMYRIRYALLDEPLVSIIIPNKDNIDILQSCVQSIMEKTTYMNYEIIIAENDSEQSATWIYYDTLKSLPNVRIVSCYSQGSFNFSAINNNAVKHAAGEYFIFLNNDTEIISGGWIEEMLMYAQRDDVGAVGAKLYYPDDTLQHGGVVLGLCGVAGHIQKGSPRSALGYFGNLRYARNVSCVTGACMMVRRTVFNEVGGFNEKFAYAFNDADLCLRIRALEYLIVWTPFAELYHYEFKTRGDDLSIENRPRFSAEVKRFQAVWGIELAKGDPYFNPNLRLDTTDYVVKE